MVIEVEVRNVINLTGRGATVVAFARGALPKVGTFTPPLVFGAAAARQLEVSGVEKLSAMEVGGVSLGLFFKKPPTVAELKQAVPPGSRLALTDGL